MPTLDLADEVCVAIDQARENGVVRQVEVDRSPVVRPDGLDPFARDGDHAIANHLPRGHVDQSPGPDPGDLVHSDSRNERSAATSATSIWAFWRRPE